MRLKYKEKEILVNKIHAVCSMYRFSKLGMLSKNVQACIFYYFLFILGNLTYTKSHNKRLSMLKQPLLANSCDLHVVDYQISTVILERAYYVPVLSK